MFRLIIISGLVLWVTINVALYNAMAGSAYFLCFSILSAFILQILVPVVRLGRKNNDLFEPFFIFLFFFQIYYFLHPILILLEGPGFRKLIASLSPQLTAKMFFVINLATIAFYIGYFISNHRPLQRARYLGEEPRLYIFAVENSRWLSFIFIIIGITAFILMIEGNMLYYVTHLGIRAFFIRGNGWLFLLTFFTGVGALLYWYYSLCSKNEKHLLRRGLFFLGILSLYLLEGSRGHVFIVLLAGIMSYHYKVRQVKVKAMIAAILVLFVLFSAFHFFRGHQIRQERLGNVFWQSYLEKSRLSAFHKVIRQMFLSTEQLLIVLNAPPEQKLWGKNYLEPFLILIPSAIWPNKPNVNIGNFYSRHYFPGIKERGISFGPGMIGTPFLNFGLVGVVLQFFLLGFCLKGMYRLLLLRKHNHTFFLFYTLVISTVTFIGVSRGVVQSISLLLFFLIPFAAFVIIRSFLLLVQETGRRSNHDQNSIPDPNP